MSEERAENIWKIKGEDGRIFGPASMETLLTWARDGRLTPGQLLSRDDIKWEPVESCDTLEMNWVTRLPDGRFWGPVHRDAMKEAIRNGDVAEDMPQFVRSKSIDDSPEALRRENEELKAQIITLRKDFAVRAAKLEADIASVKAEQRMAVGQLSSKDLEFDAERQAFAAERSRMEAERQGLAAEKTKLKAEIVKAEKRAEVLLAQVAESESSNRSREADLARIAELEEQLKEYEKDIKMLRNENENIAADSRRKLKNAETAFLKDKEAYESQLRDSKLLKDKIAAMESKEESLRRVILQACQIIGKGEEVVAEAEAEIIQ